MTLKPCCATGSLHYGEPKGRVEKVNGYDCYIAEAPAGTRTKGVIVIIPDAFGWEFPNNLVLSDDYAKQGFTVYLPEFMGGWAPPADIMDSMKVLEAPGIWSKLANIGHIFYVARNIIPFLYFTRAAVVGPQVKDFLAQLKKNQAKNLDVGTAGFCWGGQHVTKLCHDDDFNKADDGTRLTTTGFVAHPSFLTYPGDIEKIKLPYSCAASEIDPQMSPENAKQTEEILKAKTAKQRDEGIVHEFVMYKGAHHGFAVRADEDNKVDAEAGKKAETQALDWFTKWFASPPPA